MRIPDFERTAATIIHEALHYALISQQDVLVNPQARESLENPETFISQMTFLLLNGRFYMETPLAPYELYRHQPQEILNFQFENLLEMERADLTSIRNDASKQSSARTAYQNDLRQRQFLQCS